ncbi:MAG TPA: glycosyltransferase [Xanthobacteraceae bacterium]|nr:glycosyltransferase [Xanthobacteraceae bacterium]
MHPIKVALVIPVYDDWPSFNRLIQVIDELPELGRIEFDIFVVNDGSPVPPIGAESRFRHIRSIRLVNLLCNLGNQRAVAVGLVKASQERGVEGVIVMDSDGEDRPEDIPRLIATALGNPGRIVCAQRVKRSESFSFRLFYLLYKTVFRMLSGEVIDFGNFSYIPRAELDRLLHSPPLWNQLPATLIRSRVPLIRIPAERGKRYFGRSSMKLDALVAHGLSAFSVYSDIVLVRLMIGMLAIAGLTAVGLAVAAGIRLFTDVAVPGWTTMVFSSLGIVLMQSLIFSVISAFVLLNGRSVKPIIPAIDALDFIASVEQRFVRPERTAKAS